MFGEDCFVFGVRVTLLWCSLKQPGLFQLSMWSWQKEVILTYDPDLLIKPNLALKAMNLFSYLQSNEKKNGAGVALIKSRKELLLWQIQVFEPCYITELNCMLTDPHFENILSFNIWRGESTLCFIFCSNWIMLK